MFIEPFSSRDERVGVEDAPCFDKRLYHRHGKHDSMKKASGEQCLYSEKSGF
jgi:hypothetical protein